MEFSHLATICVVLISITSNSRFGSNASSVSCHHSFGVVRNLNVTVRSEGGEDPGRTQPLGNAFIWVNDVNYAPQKRGFNLAVFDARTGYLLTRDRFDTRNSVEEATRLKQFLQNLPQDSIVLLAIQDDAYGTGSAALPTVELQSIGAQNTSSIGNRTSHAVIGYKGTDSVQWKTERYNPKGTGPTQVSALISVSCSYVPEVSTTCSQFNVAAPKYGGRCTGESSNNSSSPCQLVVDGTSIKGWLSSSSDEIDAWIRIGFHTTFTVNKLRIKQATDAPKRIEEVLVEFSDCSSELITLQRDILDFQDFRFLTRRIEWTKFIVKKVFTAGNGVGIQEIEFYNDMCRQKTICDVMHVQSGSQSDRYRLDTTKFPFMVDAGNEVHVLLTSESRAASPRYEIEIGAYENNKTHLTCYRDGSTKTVLIQNISTPLILKENEQRSFWIELENDRLVFGSGEKIYLFWRDISPIKVKYVFFSAPGTSATIQICGRLDHCFNGASYYWPLDVITYLIQGSHGNGSEKGTVHGSGIIHEAPTKLGISPLALYVNGSESWADLGDFKGTFVSDPSLAVDGMTVMFKATVQGSGMGYLLSSGAEKSRGFAVYYNDTTMYFRVRDGDKLWEVKGSYVKNSWQTLAFTWNHFNGLSAVIVGSIPTVLRDATGKAVTPSPDFDSVLTVGRPSSESANYGQAAIRDVVIWEKYLTNEQMKKLHPCNDPETCPDGWQYFDGSCYKAFNSSVSFPNAHSSCLSQNANLVKVTSIQENAFVNTLSQSTSWIGLKKAHDGSYYWQDTTILSYENWKSGASLNQDCVVMEANGEWSVSLCTVNQDTYVCEIAPSMYLGCYHDDGISSAFRFEPGGYPRDRMTPGLCRQVCGDVYFQFAALKRGHMCLCSNLTSVVNESAPDLCLVPCSGAGDLKCGGETHISVYQAIKMVPATLEISTLSSVMTFRNFNITLNLTSPDYLIPESYFLDIGDGSSYQTVQPVITHAFLHPDTYMIRGEVVLRHNETGEYLTVQSFTRITAVSNISNVQVICPPAAPANKTFSCALKFSHGGSLEVRVFAENEEKLTAIPTDADIISMGSASPKAEDEANTTSDGLYVLAGMPAKGAGQLCAIDAEFIQGGFVEIMVLEPFCVKSGERYCPATSSCTSPQIPCPSRASKSCGNDTVIGFSEGDCASLSNNSCCMQRSLTERNSDFRRKENASYMVFIRTAGLVRLIFNTDEQQMNVEQGDVFALLFPANGSAAKLKSSSAGSSLFYSSSVVNRTGFQSLRGHRSPKTADSPQEVPQQPAVVIHYTAVSEVLLPISFPSAGSQPILISLSNKRDTIKSSFLITLEDQIMGLNLTIPDALPFNETVNITAAIGRGSNVTYLWEFGDGSNETTLYSWFSYIFNSTGVKTVRVTATNQVGVASVWCILAVQERISGLDFKEDALRPIENGTTANISWILYQGSHVDFTIEFGNGTPEVKNLTNMKVPSAILFAIYRKNFSLPGNYMVTITASNLINNANISGILSVQQVLSGVEMKHPAFVYTNDTFNFTLMPHPGNEARYTLRFSDGTSKNSSDRVIPHLFSEARIYEVILIAANDVSSIVIKCKITVQDKIQGLQWRSFYHSVGVNMEASFRYILLAGSGVSLRVDFGDGSTDVLNRNITVGDILAVVSMHNYFQPGDYVVSINASNLMGSLSINTTVHVETPVTGLEPAIARGSIENVTDGACSLVLYIQVNDTVTITITIQNGTNVNLTLDFGDSPSESHYIDRDFPLSGVTLKHLYTEEGEYNITVTGSNQNLNSQSRVCQVTVQYPVGKLTLASDSPRPTNGTANFNVSFSAPHPSGPLRYRWHFGDNITDSGNLSFANHRYTKHGVYNASVIVSNNVSSAVASVLVDIQDVIRGVKCSAFPTRWDDNVPEGERTKVKAFVLDKGYFPKEHNVLFNASIENGTSVVYIWNFNDGSESNTGEGNNCSHKFNTSGHYTVIVTAKNNISNESSECNITVEDSISQVSLSNDGPKNKSENMTFTMTVANPGTDACYTIQIDSDKFRYYRSGSPLSCNASTERSFDTRTAGKYNETFRHFYGRQITYPVRLHAENRVSRVILNDTTTMAVVTKGECLNPTIEISGIGKSPGNRTRYKKSETIDIKTVNKVICYNSSATFTWYIDKLDENSKPVSGLLNKTLVGIERHSPTLYIPSRFLDYGNYTLSFLMQMNSEKDVRSIEKVYIEIVHSPLVVKLKGGSEKTVGDNTTLKLDATDSYDPDAENKNSTQEKLKEFEIYWSCMQDYETLPTNVTIRVPVAGYYNVNAVNFTGCFGDGPGQLNYSNSKWKITIRTRLMRPGSRNNFSIIVKKGHRKANFDQNVIVVKGDPPEMSTECLQNCDTKINPSSKFAIKGKCTSCRPGEAITYEWKVLRCTLASQCTVMDLKEKIRTSLFSESLVIKPNSFEGGLSYKFTVTGKLSGGQEGNSTYTVRVNKPPKDGHCSVTPRSGIALETVFRLSCEDWRDDDSPLVYQFFYQTKRNGRNVSLGIGMDHTRNITLQNGEIYIFAKISDKLKASVTVEVVPKSVEVKKNTSFAELKKNAGKKLDTIFDTGNTREAVIFVIGVAGILNDDPSDNAQTNTDEKQFRSDLVAKVVKNIPISNKTTLQDMAQVCGSVREIMAKPEQVSEEAQEQAYELFGNAVKALNDKVKDPKESSEDVEDTSQAVFGGMVNVIRSATEDSSKSGYQSRNMTEKSLALVNDLTIALLVSKLPGEEPTELKTEKMTMAVSRKNPNDIGKKTRAGESEVQLPSNFLANASDLKQVHMVSSTPLYAWGDGARLLNNSKQVSFTLFAGGNDTQDREELTVKNLIEEISILIPREWDDSYKDNITRKMHKDRFNIHEFIIKSNESTIHIQVELDFDVEVQLFVRRGSEPKPSEGLYDYNTTLPVGRFPTAVNGDNDNSTNSTNPFSYVFFLTNTMLNWTAAGSYFCAVRFRVPENRTYTEKVLQKLESGSVSYTFMVFTSACLYFDKEQEKWSYDDCKVGPKTSVKATECLCSHLTTFGSDFFVAPNKINLKELDVEDLLRSPATLIAVCVVLSVYLLCLIPARKADKNDSLKTGVTPLPDNDSRDTYCYEIHVHTGFLRGSGSSAAVSMVLVGALGDSEPRTLKDPARKIFKTGAVDAFLFTVPQSLGNLKQIRVWHNNEGGYPSWYLLRIMIQDIQTDQRWWFVCDDWLAVDESDGKIEKNLYPASTKDLTKFNVLFTSEVRKNLTDGHIWFSVVARPVRSSFTRVQRLTCCLSILLSTMVANAMWYEVGEDETPQNAIKILGFHFSIRQVSIGVMSSLVVFPANLIIVTMFRKAKPKPNRYKVKTVEEVEDVDIDSAEQGSKQATPKGLPYWFVYVAYVLAFAVSITSGSFVVLYGMEFGPEKSAQWLSSMTISFIQDVLFTQPIKVFILATLFALLIKDPKKAEENAYADVNALASDEEWLHKKTEDLDPEVQKTLKKLINDKPPDEAKLEIARQLRMKERQMKSIIGEITWYVIFLLILLIISYGNRDPMTYDVTSYMKNTFEKATYSGNITYNKVHEIKHWWRWLTNTLIPSLYPTTSYDDVTPYQSGFVADIPTAWILGVSRLRQLRIKKNSCKYSPVLYQVIEECNDFYSMENEEQGSFLPGWKPKPLVPRSNLTAIIPNLTSQPQGKGPWDYQTGSELKTYPYWGYKATYSPGGYVQELSRDEASSLEAVLGNLSSNNWLDRYTRAIFAEFAIYNANTNLFGVVTLLFEQLPTGSLIPYPSIITLRLFRYVAGEMYFVLACEFVYLLFCVYFVFREIKLFIKIGKEHLKDAWSVVEIFVTLASLAVVTLYFLRLRFTEDALRDMRSNPSSFVSFHYTAYLDEWLKCIMGIIVFFSFLKMFRLLRFNRRMSLLQQTIKRCAENLLSFMFMFFLAFLAFALLANLVFGQSMEGFGTFLRSCASLMDTILGKFTLKDMADANRIIGPIFFYTYTVSMIFVMINMFLSIINDAFSEVRSDVSKQSNDHEIVEFMIHRLKENIGKSIGHAIRPEYKEPKSELECNFDKIADNADNAMHFMRNIAFEDIRKTRWFQLDNCNEKKKNLIRLLMEVEWDYYEEELCDSIPVFEKFLSDYSNEELQQCLHRYRQKRLVEDLAFERVNGGQTESSDSDGDGSDDNSSDDENPSNDEDATDTDHAPDDDGMEATGGSRAGSAICRPVSNVRDQTESELREIKSPAVLITDAELGLERGPDYSSFEQTSGSSDRRSSAISLLVDPHVQVTDDELVKVLEDVERDTQSRCATDAELDSILYGELSRSYESDPDHSRSGNKSGIKKRRKMKIEEKPKEKSKRGAWVCEEDHDEDDPGEQPAKKPSNKKNKPKKDAPLNEALGEQENEGYEAEEDETAKPQKKTAKKKKKDVLLEEQVETAAKKKKTKKKSEGESVSNLASENLPEEETNLENMDRITDLQNPEEHEKIKKKKKAKKKTVDGASETTELQEETPQSRKKKNKGKRNARSDLAVQEEEERAALNEADEMKEKAPDTKRKKKGKKVPLAMEDESEC